MKAQRKKLLSLKFREYRQSRIILALLLAALFMIVLLSCRQLTVSGALIPIASQDSRVEQGERDLSGIWDGSLSFNFAGEIVEGHLTLILRQHQDHWGSELILTAKGTTGSAYLPEFQVENDSFSFRIAIIEKVEIALSGGLKDNHLKGKIQFFVSDEMAGESAFNLTKPKKLIDIFYALAGQRPDPNFNPPIENPAYPRGMGPVVLIDEAHNNFHTMEGRYKSFADLLARDGYVVRPNKSSFERDSLKSADILVVSNALSDQNMKDWSLPTYSAFKDDEIAHVRDWVCEGGALLLIADHMPWPGCAEKLATAFGVDWKNGYARPKERGRLIFRRSDGSLVDHSITKGRSESERVDSVATFGGSAFQVGKDAEPLFIFGEGAVCYMAEALGKVTEQTPIVPIDGWLQGAVMRFGKGRVAFFGEAAMFSAQLTGLPGRPMGMNNPIASENPQFLLNLMHWLSGLQGVSREVSLTLSQ